MQQSPVARTHAPKTEEDGDGEGEREDGHGVADDVDCVRVVRRPLVVHLRVLVEDDGLALAVVGARLPHAVIAAESGGVS